MNERVSRTDVPDAVASYSALRTKEQACFLAHFAHDLTVVARDAYEVGGDGLSDPALVRAINEVQHRVTSHLSALLRDDPKRYPDGVLIEIFLEGYGNITLDRQLSAAFERAMSRTKAAG